MPGCPYFLPLYTSWSPGNQGVMLHGGMMEFIIYDEEVMHSIYEEVMLHGGMMAYSLGQWPKAPKNITVIDGADEILVREWRRSTLQSHYTRRCVGLNIKGLDKNNMPRSG